jgi:uncharacterized protein (TIGR02646 family)
VTPFIRGKEPEFWKSKEQKWLASEMSTEIDPLTWEHQRRRLGHWFHELARGPNEPLDRYAYCEGPLGETSPATIDHCAPRSVFPELSLAWGNLLPACHTCNSQHKRDRWSCALLRPDIDDVGRFLDFDELTGELAPKPGLDRYEVARVRLSIRVYGLNTTARCRARLNCVTDLRNACKFPSDTLTIEERAKGGPHRFVAQRFLESIGYAPAPTSREP